eukprot:2546399-Alexandrium_andersonii.AAC.1
MRNGRCYTAARVESGDHLGHRAGDNTSTRALRTTTRPRTWTAAMARLLRTSPWHRSNDTIPSALAAEHAPRTVN